MHSRELSRCRKTLWRCWLSRQRCTWLWTQHRVTLQSTQTTHSSTRQAHQAAGDFYFPAHHACARALSGCDTRLRTSHQIWHVASQQTRPQFCGLEKCVYQKQQRKSNIVDELWLLTEWHIIQYISQGRVETPSKGGEHLCCSFLANLLQYLSAKTYQNTMRFEKVIAEMKGCIFGPSIVSSTSFWYDIIIFAILCCGHLDSMASFCRAMLCISTAYVVMRCPSVRLSRSWILSKRVIVSSNLFHPAFG